MKGRQNYGIREIVWYKNVSYTSMTT